MTKNYFRIFTIFFLLISFSISSSYAQDMSIFDVARKGTLKDLSPLLRKNSNIINSKNENGYSVLTLACYSGNIEVAKYLISNVKDINAGSNYGTPIMAASVKGYSKLVKLLIEKGADLNKADPNGTTALHYAVIFKFDEIAELLITSNADTSLKDNRGKTALDYANIMNNKKIINLIKKTN